jgi:hypothetical protein
MEASLPEEQNVKDLGLAVIIEELKQCENEKRKQTLQTEFFKRLSSPHFDRCNKSARKLLIGFPDWEDRRNDIFQRSFIQGFERIQTFKTKSEWGEVECKKVVLFWLARIANNFMLTDLKTAKEESQQLEGFAIFLESETNEGDIAKGYFKPTYDRATFDMIWAKLSPMAKEVLIACLDADTLEEDNTRHLPEEVLTKIATKYGVTKSALRQAKGRALKLIRSCKIEN